jgi:murein DD-endopeptidase MepM/ murein hydrolase activator NlpD
MGNLRSGVGVRSNPFGGSSLEYHKGQDISAPSGTPVVATADGNIVIAGWLRGYGQVVYIDHGNGITTRYGHLSRIDVAVGQMIKQGERLGLVGSTGRSTGPHLHYEVRINGQPASPIQYLPAVPPLK